MKKESVSDVQNLKVKISAIASKMEGYVMNYPMADFAKELRQLSSEINETTTKIVSRYTIACEVIAEYQKLQCTGDTSDYSYFKKWLNERI